MCREGTFPPHIMRINLEIAAIAELKGVPSPTQKRAYLTCLNVVQEVWCDGECIAAEGAEDAECEVKCAKNSEWETKCHFEDDADSTDPEVASFGVLSAWYDAPGCGYWWC